MMTGCWGLFTHTINWQPQLELEKFVITVVFPLQFFSIPPKKHHKVQVLFAGISFEGVVAYEA